MCQMAHLLTTSTNFFWTPYTRSLQNYPLGDVRRIPLLRTSVKIFTRSASGKARTCFLSRFSESRRTLADETCSRGCNARYAQHAHCEVGALLRERGAEQLMRQITL